VAELGEILRSDGVALDVQARTVSHAGQRIDLTRKEFDILILLLRKRGHVLTSNFLLEAVWGYDLGEYNDPHTVTVHLSSLRRKLGPRLGRRIVTVPGSGYRFELQGALTRRRALAHDRQHPSRGRRHKSASLSKKCLLGSGRL
jgi:DNA-binding response OmpR family regulator